MQSKSEYPVWMRVFCIACTIAFISLVSALIVVNVLAIEGLPLTPVGRMLTFHKPDTIYQP